MVNRNSIATTSSVRQGIRALAIKVIASICIAVLVAMMLPLPYAHADEEPVSFQYDLGDGTLVWCTVTSNTTVAVGRSNAADRDDFAVDAGFSGTLSLPDTVSYGGSTYQVTAIQDYAFSGGMGRAASLTGVVIPATVTTIGASAFAYSVLENIDLSHAHSLRTIGDSAFISCKQLRDVDFPPSVQSIGHYAFAYCAALASINFLDGSQLTTLGDGAFAGQVGVEGSLTSITLPASLVAVPRSLFQHQGNLVNVYFLGETLVNIGESAFADCASLESVAIPRLTAASLQFGQRAFLRCVGLHTVIFLGDAAGYTSIGTGANAPFYGCTAVKSVVYWGSSPPKASSGGSNPGGQTAAPVPSDSEHYYYPIIFYASNTDAQAQANPIGSVRVRDDVLVSATNAGTLSAVDNVQIFDDGGGIPTPPLGTFWVFSGDLGANDTFVGKTVAWPSSVFDLPTATIVFDAANYYYSGQPVGVGFTVLDMSGAQLRVNSDYSVQVSLNGNAVALDTIIDLGTYELKLTGMGAYSGVRTVFFTITKWVASWRHLYGADRYLTMQQVSLATYPSGTTVTTAILASGQNFPDALAASGLAGLESAPIILTAPDSLSTEARNELIRLNVRNVVIIGGPSAVSNDVLNQVSNMSSRPSVSRIQGANRAETAATIYQRAARNGLGASGLAIICSGVNPADALSIAPYASATESPIFLVGTDGELDANTVQVMKTGNFTRIIIVGGTSVVSDSVKAQVPGATYERWSGSDRYATSIDVATHATTETVLSWDNLALVNGVNEAFPDSLSAASLTGNKGSVLLLVEDSPAGRQAINQVLKPQKLNISMGNFIGGDVRITPTLRNDITAVWS
jgi:putative cell wall-binding protein